MQLFALIVGYSVIGAVSLLVGTGCVFAIVNCIKFALQVRADDAAELMRQRLAGQLHGEAYWFSEDTATYRLLQMFADDFRRGVTPDTSAIRDKWRAMRETKAEGA